MAGERFINGFLDLLSIQFISRFGKKPMHFFGLLGMITFLTGFGIILYLIIERIHVGPDYGLANRPPFYISLTTVIMGTLFFLAGYIGELIARSAADRNHYLIEQRLD